jgi:tetratricopeptide (TPR) repeat protein
MICFAYSGNKKINVQVELNKGIQFLNNNDINNAINSFNTVIKADPKNATAHYYLGVCFQKQGNNDGALQKYNKAIELKSDYIEAIYAKGNLQYILKQYEPSISTMNKIIQIYTEKKLAPNPLLGEVYYKLAMSYSYLQNIDNAINYFKKSIEINPQNAYAHYYLGMAYYNKKQKDLAIQHLNIFLQLAPDAPEAPQVKNLLSQISG